MQRVFSSSFAFFTFDGGRRDSEGRVGALSQLIAALHHCSLFGRVCERKNVRLRFLSASINPTLTSNPPRAR